jgi:hypothetical protein
MTGSDLVEVIDSSKRRMSESHHGKDGNYIEVEYIAGCRTVAKVQ